ncbi:SET domain-containing protein 8 [Fulvia fulva]|uniref:SET domain-containing protein 8 n=1 Tax=Passalora fulva TaxID=5499 RepID=A0A9Q8L7B1_PASFU|nr:SET domain-containing protein 8 [Fulvia fulva]KAK4634138.1 SET domain-containing protein 8 [Fulvia fulva]UJO12172.1 SET domain-containing protein 8 [Fulvia fulva]WPV09669.1 SET domain-containing protein 8 [Fulvia fulva]WPV24287.1 SET domain-containing protein 8 [Fulvia fulva]
MLIKRGKAEGWLHLDIEGVTTWATASGIGFTNASPKIVPGRGIGLVTDRNLDYSESGKPLEILKISEDLVLSVEAVKQQAQFDRDFREVLDSLADFGQTPRGAILTFLLFQASVSCPYLPGRVGVHTPFTDYVKTLPCELLPTFWNPPERQLLVGTTLAPAVTSKLKSLELEYDQLCSSVAKTRWYQLVQDHIDLDDWMQVDAMFRSRALDFYGSCMIPGMDLASHAAGDSTNAFYDRADDKYYLWLLEDKNLPLGHEVSITYGDEKGACEMLFSYGFLDPEMETAETLFLSLKIPDNDVAKTAKMKVAGCAPGFKIIDTPSSTKSNASAEAAEAESTSTNSNEPPVGGIDWQGNFIWLLCVSKDEGLRFELARTIDGEEEMRAIFVDRELTGADDLRHALSQSELWPVYKLRAIVILQQRVFDQLQILYSTQEEVEAVLHGDASSVREAPYQQAMKLRSLEFELLEKAYEEFERQKLELAESSVVQKHLASMTGDQST